MIIVFFINILGRIKMDAKEFSELLTRSIFTLIKEDKFGISIYHSQNDLTYEKF